MSKLINKIKFENNRNVFESLTNKDCGKYYKRLKRWEKALEILEKAYRQNPSDKSLLLEKSQCQIELTKINEALNDLKQYNQLNLNYFPVKEKKIECLYQFNRFEDSFKFNFNTLCDNPAKSRDYCENAKIVIRKTLDQSIGQYAGPCLLNQRRQIKQLKKEAQIKSKPQWKLLKEQNECDAQSVRSIEVIRKPPIIIKGLEQKKCILNSLYLGDATAVDANFLENLSKDHRVNLKQIPDSSKAILDHASECSEKLKIWRTMMKSRSPMYSKKLGSNKTEMFRIQYQTRRDVFNQLDEIKRIFENGSIKELTEFVSKILENYYSIKTVKILPRKFELANEITNYVALKYLSLIKIPENLNQISDLKIRLAVLLNISKNVNIETTKMSIEFGDKSKFCDTTAPDYSYLRYKRKVDKYERELNLWEYSIVKCFYLNEISLMHLIQFKYDECRTSSRKCCEEAELCGNIIWEFFGRLNLIRSDCLQNMFGDVKENLIKLELLVIGKMNENVLDFIRMVKFVTDEMQNKTPGIIKKLKF